MEELRLDKNESFDDNSYLNSNVSESPIIIAKMRLEVGELLASGGHTQAVVLVEFENSPAKEIGTLQLNGSKKTKTRATYE